MAACCSPPAAFSRRHLGWYRQNSLDHLLSTRSYPGSAAMPKDAAYYASASKIAPRAARHVNTQLYLRGPKNQEQKGTAKVRGISSFVIGHLSLAPTNDKWLVTNDKSVILHSLA